ncbi:MAG TPA: hypothetical protein VFU46_08730 [Gemmatimonadales bacterium]|nr:hypothetical protein [Gemmatimonadales bacterium]
MTDLRVPAEPGDGAPDARATDTGSLALLAGGGVALLGGAVWAIIVGITEYEVGYVAWAIGGLVGVAMTRTTIERGRRMGVFAALFAAAGLAFGKLLIVQFVAGPAFERELGADSVAAARAAAWQLRQARRFPDSIQAALDGLGESDTLPDALWDRMIAAGRAHVATLPEAERSKLTARYVSSVRASVGLWQELTWQLSGWDLLWFGLAVSTAWGMLVRPAAARAAPR